jgi:hypothetical protein
MEEDKLDQFRGPEEDELEDFRVKKDFSILPRKKRGRRNKEQEDTSEKFIIKIPLEWISRVSHLSRKSLHVGLALWYRFGLKKKVNPIKMKRSVLELFDLTAETYNKTLVKMEKEGLVTVERFAGQRPKVSIIEDTTSKQDKKGI